MPKSPGSFRLLDNTERGNMTDGQISWSEAKSCFGRALQHAVAGFPQCSPASDSIPPKASGPHRGAKRRDEAQKQF
jgi:hypothetical protein